MKTSDKAVQKEKQYVNLNRYLICPRCGGLVAYHLRFRHPCFRAHLKEMERDIARMSWTIRTG